MKINNKEGITFLIDKEGNIFHSVLKGKTAYPTSTESKQR